MEFPLVSTDWLEKNLYNDQLVLIDASMKKVVGKKEITYASPRFISNSMKLDLEGALCNLASDQVHAFPTEDQFVLETERLGITSDSIVVIYDNQGIYSSPRAWLIFQAMGVKNVFVLDGGLPQWISEGKETVGTLCCDYNGPSSITANYSPELVCDSAYVSEKLGNRGVTILDARSKERFAGSAPEPRPGVRSGHIPESANLPFANVLDNHKFKKAEDLTNVFAELVEDQDQELVFSCGSGITACIILLASTIAGYRNTVLYDGSWSDWGSDVSLPIGPS